MVDIPTIEWIEQDPSVDPSGSRDLKSTGAGFLKTLSTSPTEELDFGSVNITGSGSISNTKLVYFRASDLGDASGIFNMRFFLNSSSSWGAGTYRFLERKTLHFIPDLELTSADEDIAITIPSSPNVSGTIKEPEYPLGSPWVSGTLDNDVSQYIYLAVEVGNNVPVGTYGGAGLGTFRYRLLFDFS